MTIEIEAKTVYTTGDSYPDLITLFIKGYKIVHYYQEQRIADGFVQSFEQFLRKRDTAIAFHAKVETEQILPGHRYEDTFGETYVYKAVLSPSFASNLDALALLKTNF